MRARVRHDGLHEVLGDAHALLGDLQVLGVPLATSERSWSLVSLVAGVRSDSLGLELVIAGAVGAVLTFNVRLFVGAVLIYEGAL